MSSKMFAISKSNKVPSKTSPLLRGNWWLKIGQYTGGFIFSVSQEENGCIRLEKSRLFKNLAIVGCLLWILAHLSQQIFLTLLGVEMDFSQVIKKAKEAGMTPTDNYTFGLAYFGYIASLVLYFYFALRGSLKNGFESVNNELAELELDMGIKEPVGSSNKLVAFFVLNCLLTMVAMVTNVLFITAMTNVKDDPIAGQILMYFTMISNVAHTFSSPCYLVLFLSFLHLIGSTNQTIKEMNDQMIQHLDQVGPTIQMQSPIQVAAMGSKCLKLFHLIEQNFSNFLFAEIFLSMWVLVVGLFYAIGLVPTIVARMDSDPLNLATSTGSFQGLISVHCLLKLGYLFGYGQTLTGTTTRLRKGLEQYYSRQVHRMSMNLCLEFDNMIWNLRNRAPLRPLDLFDLRMSSALTAASVMVTYVVILLQFKKGDS